MKVKIFLLVFSIAGFLIFFPSCKKSNDAGPSTNSISATLTAPSGTTSFKSTSNIFGNFYTVSQMYYLQGAQVVDGDSLTLEILFYDTLAINKPYLITQSPIGDVHVNYIKWATNLVYVPDFFSPVGTLTVTSMNQTTHAVAGTFSGKFFSSDTDSIVISNGEFNIITPAVQ